MVSSKSPARATGIDRAKFEEGEAMNINNSKLTEEEKLAIGVEVVFAPENASLSIPDAQVSDFDECRCGDYRRDHYNLAGPCRYNQHNFLDSPDSCLEFRLCHMALRTLPAIQEELENE